jgi:hypothetical protein
VTSLLLLLFVSFDCHSLLDCLSLCLCVSVYLSVSLSLSLCLCLSLSLSFSLKRVESDTSQGFDRSSCCPPFSFLINFPQLDCSPTPPTLGFLFLLIVSPHPPPLPCPPAPPLVSSPQSHSRASSFIVISCCRSLSEQTKPNYSGPRHLLCCFCFLPH